MASCTWLLSSTLHQLERMENQYSSNWSLGHLEWHWKSFTRQMDRTHQTIQSSSQQPSVPTQLLSALQVELYNVNDIYNSYKPIIIPTINLLATNPSINGNSNYNHHIRRSLLPFLGNALSWLTWTATTRDVNTIRKRVNQLITAQNVQQDTLVHVISILNITGYAAQVKRQHTIIIMDKVNETVCDVNNLYNITSSLATSLHYYQLVLLIRSVLANLQDSLSYIRVSLHIMDCINAAMTGTLSPYILPLTDLNQMLFHIKETLPSTVHLPVSSEDTLRFYRYLCAHVLIANQQFLLLIAVPIQDHNQQLSIFKIFTLDIPHEHFTAHYEIDTPYLSITQDKTMAVEISDKQYTTFKEANGQFCSTYTVFQPLANPPSCITALYSKNTTNIAARCSLQIRKVHTISICTFIASNIWLITSAPTTVMTGMTLVCPEGPTKLITLWKPIHILHLPPACSATSPYFIYIHTMNLQQ